MPTVGTGRWPLPGSAVEEVDFGAEPGTPSWALDLLDLDVRLTATPNEPRDEVFIGIADAADLDADLDAVAHDEISDVVDGRPVVDVEPAPAAGAPAVVAGGVAPHDRYPLGLEAELDPALSRWMWLVKWFLAIPHYVVLLFLWVAFAVVTVVAGFAILFTGRYPRSLFEFNVGVLRWTWRVSYYASSGGVGTDRYPAFSLRPRPGDLTRLDVAYPERLSRGLVLIKWWLLAIPHYLIVGVLLGSVTWLRVDDSPVRIELPGGEGVLGLIVLIAAVILLVTGSYPRALFDLIIGLNRWVYRVVAYAALMTDRYPPFRLDQGGSEPPPPPPPGGDDPGAAAADLPDGAAEPALSS